ncbi:hypothetical protein PIB30_047128 [Stylosanthes scabra]|uniref:RING-type E3 ubiquitin transferase n=1 Tax=Stylosanthes scabra TaxID=79078 RepID=A0ABU6UIT3_9FABA|nr:hypothetical protein [Stylosanthes scabra]
MKKAQVCEGSSKATGPTTTTSRYGKRPFVVVEEEDEQLDDVADANNNELVTVNEAGKKGPSVEDNSFTVFLSDPDILHCPICFHPFTNVIYQCENGHVACSVCCVNLGNKCASCSLPIGSIRNRALEKVLESIKLPCPNAKHGCNDTLLYSEKCGHESKCFFVPCTCPHKDCEFVSSVFDLPAHFRSEHGSSTVVRFLYSEPFNITLKAEDEDTILQAESDGKLFILQNLVTSLGNAVNVFCIQPDSMAIYQCEISAMSNGCSLGIKYHAKNIQKFTVSTDLSSRFLVIPSGYFGASEPFNLEIRILYLEAWKIICC